MKQLYSTAEAAEYLDLSVSAIKYHVYVADNLKPQRIGHSLVFTRKQLDEFSKNRRAPGRPRQDKGEQNEHDSLSPR